LTDFRGEGCSISADVKVSRMDLSSIFDRILLALISVITNLVNYPMVVEERAVNMVLDFLS
jgi:hypothetical protein